MRAAQGSKLVLSEVNVTLAFWVWVKEKGHLAGQIR